MALKLTSGSKVHELTRDQHISPVMSIQRFTNEHRQVHVRFLSTGSTARVGPKDRRFVADRAWDQKCEGATGKAIEDAFQGLMNNVLRGKRLLTDKDHGKITRFFALLVARSYYVANPIPDVVVNGIVGEQLTQDQEETIEKNGYVFVGQDGRLPSRFMTSIQIQMDLDRFETGWSGARWGIVESAEAEFVCPDRFHNFKLVGFPPFIPITPQLILQVGMPNINLPRLGVAQVNLVTAAIAEQFYFARHLSKAPIYDSEMEQSA